MLRYRCSLAVVGRFKSNAASPQECLELPLDLPVPTNFEPGPFQLDPRLTGSQNNHLDRVAATRVLLKQTNELAQLPNVDVAITRSPQL